MSGKIVKFTPVAIDRLPLSDGDWIEVKRDLNTGETKLLENAGLGIPVRMADGTVYTPIDWSRYEIERAAVFLLGWSLKGEDDKVVPLLKKTGDVDVTAIKALDPADFAEINVAIVDHVLRRAEERKKERAAARGTTPPTSQNPEPSNS